MLVLSSLLTACAPQDDAFPTADAGPSLHGVPGQEYVFDGSLSRGETWSWSLLSQPQGSVLSSADLVDADTPWPVLRPDAAGAYTLELEVCSDGAWCERSQTRAYVGPEGQSALEQLILDTRRVSLGLALAGRSGTTNEAPVAVATARAGLRASSEVTLDGGDSYDPDGDPLRYRWSFASLPAGSTLSAADLHSSTQSSASFAPDLSGTYALRLTVRDAQRWDSALVTVIVRNQEDSDPLD